MDSFIRPRKGYELTVGGGGGVNAYGTRNYLLLGTGSLNRRHHWKQSFCVFRLPVDIMKYGIKNVKLGISRKDFSEF
jgi:hypothetical protein